MKSNPASRHGGGGASSLPCVVAAWLGFRVFQEPRASASAGRQINSPLTTPLHLTGSPGRAPSRERGSCTGGLKQLPQWKSQRGGGLLSSPGWPGWWDTGVLGKPLPSRRQARGAGDSV